MPDDIAYPLGSTQNRSEDKMRKFLSKYQCDWGHISFLLALLLAISFYFSDAFLASQKAENLMMILPVSLIGVGICLWQIFLSIKPRDPIKPGVADHESTQHSPSTHSTSESVLSAQPETSPNETRLFKYRVPIFMGLLGLFLIGLIYVAFDIATFLFVWLSLLMQGEQKKLLAFFYSLIFALAVTWCLKLMVPFPFTTFFF